MTRLILSPALLLVLAPLAGTAYAADPEFRVGLVTESREYERETSNARSPAYGYRPTKSGRAV
jgi:hypothetical protein